MAPEKKAQANQPAAVDCSTAQANINTLNSKKECL